MNNSEHKWDLRFLELAELVASWSKDPSTKVGAVIVGVFQLHDGSLLRRPGREEMNKSTDNLGATDEEVADSLREDVIAAFKICNQQRARIAALESELATLKKDSTIIITTPFPFLHSDFLTLMNDIGRLGHEKFGADAFEIAGSGRKILRHQKVEIMAHIRQHVRDYERGRPHDKLSTTQAHLAAAAFNCMLEYIFSQGE
jgi:hypothetical protein